MTPATSQATGEEYGIGQDRDQALLSEDNKEALEVSPFNVQAVMSNVDKQASRLTQSLGNCLSPASSSASAPSSMVGSPRVASSVSSPAQASIRDQSPHAQAGGLTDESTAELPKELCPNSRTSDLLLHTPESQRQPQRVPPSSVLSSSSLTVPLSATTHLDATCQSARCRPLRSYRKRRILRTMGLHRHSHKAARLSDIKCRCAPPANPCPMCGGRQNNTMPMDTETMSLRERVALVDASFHPVLSFPEDVSLPIHCEGLLKSGLWQDKPAAKRSRGAHRHPHHYRGSLMLVEDYRQHTKKRLQNNNNNHHHHDQGKVLALVTNGNGQDTKKKKAKNNVLLGSAGQNNRNNGGSAPSTASVIKNFSEKIKNKYDSKAKSKGATTKKKTMASMPKKVKRKASKMSKDTMKKKKEAEMRKEEEDDLEALYLDQGFADIDGENGGGSLSASASQSSLRDLGHQSHRGSRRRVDNSYDINNIVIPLSMAASVPVEQPQYKEIVTPKWREIPMRDVSLPSVATVTAAVLDSLAIKLEKTNGVAQSAEQPKPCELESALQGKQTERVPDVERKTVGEEEEEEDLSDEAYALRHLKLELEEKKRFRNFVQYPPLRRSRARSDVSLSAIDKGESMPQSEEGSLSSRPTTPVLMKSLPSLTSGRAGSLEESFVNLQSQRPRTMSVSTPASRRETRQGSQAGQDGAEAHRDLMVEPWPRRSFPLVTEEFESMLREAPPEYKVVVHQHETRYASSNTPKAPVRAVDSSDRDLLGEAARAAQTVLDGMAGVGDSVALSPQSASASASVSSAADDDIADPEWTGGADNSTSSGGSYKRGRSRRILDDPNDPEWLGSDTPRKNKNKR
ncbi:hypothetical protein EGW08_020288 [Elysia chlorotica]|uniref:PEHE domain-containing protein n=1 Tax=Elysia chlorotica TaxID=188477 RepID=A0A3S0Z8R0_ELYCH|nr:hypothetical protein EGW08_020288 [Elysia chlorotica]